MPGTQVKRDRGSSGSTSRSGLDSAEAFANSGWMESAPADPVVSLPFEEALSRLEELVAAMERGDVPLAELVAKFEEGDKLLRRCQGCLSEAELKIERLRKDRTGVQTESFEEDGESSAE